MRQMAVALCLVTAVLAGAAHAGLVKNANFSRKSAGDRPALESWVMPANAGGFVAVNDEGRSAPDSLRYKAVAEAARVAVTQEVACKPNTQYLLTAAFKTEGDLRPTVAVIDEAGNVAAQITAGEDRQWRLHTVAFNTRDAKKLRVEIDADAGARNTGKIAPGVCWIDDVDILTPDEATTAGARIPGYSGPPIGENIALKRPYTLSPAPNYGLCTDPGDATQLTDGVHSVGYFWAQKETVGWGGGPVEITIDLGADQPIKGASYSTAAGVAGVSWPTSILLFVSDDGKTFYGVGDLIAHAAKFGLPEPQGYSTFTFVADDINTHGRYLRLVVAAPAYIFCDEIEVYKGADTLLTADRGKAIGDTKEYLRQMRVKTGITNRLRRDLQTVEDLAAGTKLLAAQRARVDGELAAIKAELLQPVPDLPANYRATYPLSPLHARIIALSGELYRARGYRPVSVWTKCRWDMLQPTEAPPSKSPEAPTLSVAMMANEYRAEALNITNFGPRDAQAHISVTGLPGGPNPSYVTVHQVEFTESQIGIPLADALPVAPITKNASLIAIPAGMTRQVWLTFRPTDVRPGTYRGEVHIADLGARDISVPVSLRVSALRMPDQPTCSLGMWDYTDTGAYGIIQSNIKPSIADMRRHYVDTPWAGGGTAPWVGADAFDANDKLIKPLDFTRVDDWVLNKWPGSRNYAIFVSVGDSFAGAKMGDPHFLPRVSAWLQAWAAHVKEQNLKPEQFLFLIWDEPSTEDKDLLILTWARAFHASNTGFVVWEDPTHSAPEKGTVPEMFEACDVLCPHLMIYWNGAQASRDFYENLRQKGKKLWFYQCNGPARTYDPIYYHRYHFWYAWEAGAVGAGFWAYGDTSGAINSWNEMLANGTIFAPVYLDATSTTTSKHWEAVREGIEDYEYFTMLRERVVALEKAGKTSPALAQAKDLLTKGIKQVTGNYEPAKVEWKNERDRTAPDKFRIRVLEALEKLPTVQ